MVQNFNPRLKRPSKAEGAVRQNYSPKNAFSDSNTLPITGPGCQLESNGSLQALSQRFDIILLDHASKNQKAFIVTKDRQQLTELNFQEYLDAKGYRELPTQCPKCANPSASETTSSKRRRLSNSSQSPTKRHTGQTRAQPSSVSTEEDDYVSDAEDEYDGLLEGGGCEKQGIEVCQLTVYFFDAFRTMGQLACKDLVKLWIKAAHPKKQSTHPYNGGDTRERSMRDFCYEGGYTKPEYWPSHDDWKAKPEPTGCRHKEPDHIKKPERLILLVHLLCCNHEWFSLEILRKATRQIENDIPKHFTAKSIGILKEIYGARRLQKRFEDNEIDGDAKVYVTLPKPPPIKVQKGSKTMKAGKIKPEVMKQEVDDASTPGPIVDMEAETASDSEESMNVRTSPDSVSEEPATVKYTPSTTSESAYSQISQESSQQRISYSRDATPEMGARPIVPFQRRPQRLPSALDPKGQSDNITREIKTRQAGISYEQGPHGAIRRASASRSRATYPGFVQASRAGRDGVPSSSRSAKRSNMPSGRQLVADMSSAMQSSQGDSGRHLRVCHGPYQPRLTPHDGQSFLNNPSIRPLRQNYAGLSSSSSGVVGLAPSNPWQDTSELSRMRQMGGMPIDGPGNVYNEGADPNAVLTSYSSDVTSSFGSDFSNHSHREGFEARGMIETVPERHEVVDPELKSSYSTYLTSSFDNLSMRHGHEEQPPLHHGDFSIASEDRFTSFGQGYDYP